MARYIGLLLLFLFSPQVFAAGPFVWGGAGTARNLQANAQTMRIKLLETGGGTDTVTVQPPAALSAAYTLTLPGDDGTPNQFLQTNGSGVLAWAGGATVGGSDGALQYNNGGVLGGSANLFWDDTNDRFGIGTATPATPMEITDGTDYMRFALGGSPSFTLFDSGVASSMLTTEELAGSVFGLKISSAIQANSTVTALGGALRSIASPGSAPAVFAAGVVNLWSASGSPTFVSFNETGVANRGALGFTAGSADLVYKSAAENITGGTEMLRIASSGTTLTGSASVLGAGGVAGYFRAIGGTSPTVTAVGAGRIALWTLNGSDFRLRNDGDIDTILSPALLTANRTFTLPDASGTVALTSNKLSAFAATTSAELAGVISNETGTGLLVFNDTPTLTTPKVNENVALTTTATKLNYLTSATGTTGTASTNVVFSTSPVLTTPTLGAASATSVAADDGAVGTPSFTFTGDTDNGLYRVGANNPALAAGGTKVIDMKSTGVSILGTTTNDNAAAGNYGESPSASSAGVSVAASGSYVNIASISLTAGDWDVQGWAVFSPSGTVTTVSRVLAAISSSSGAADSLAAGGVIGVPPVTNAGNDSSFLPTGERRISLSGTTTIYLVGRAEYVACTTCTWTSASFIRARRPR